MYNNTKNLESHEELASQIGVSYEDFWFGDPAIYWYAFKGYKKQVRYNDTLNFQLMDYLFPAMYIAFNGNKDKKIKMAKEPQFTEKEEKNQNYVLVEYNKPTPERIEQSKKKLAELKSKKRR